MKNLPSVQVRNIEKVVDNEYYWARFARQTDGKLYGHVTFKKWSPTAKKKAIETLDSIGEPIFAVLHDTKMAKFLFGLGFKATGCLVTKPMEGREDHIFGEVVYTKNDYNNFALGVYEELGKEVLPLALVDGYGKVENLIELISKYQSKDWETSHYFSDGVYTRVSRIPANFMFVGYPHKNRTNCTVATGALTVLLVDELGYATDMGVVSGHNTFVTDAGVRKVCYTHEETIMINSFPLAGIPEEFHNKESVDTLEDYVFYKENNQ